jgi:hypothetical protein
MTALPAKGLKLTADRAAAFDGSDTPLIPRAAAPAVDFGTNT